MASALPASSIRTSIPLSLSILPLFYVDPTRLDRVRRQTLLLSYLLPPLPRKHSASACGAVAAFYFLLHVVLHSCTQKRSGACRESGRKSPLSAWRSRLGLAIPTQALSRRYAPAPAHRRCPARTPPRSIMGSPDCQRWERTL